MTSFMIMTYNIRNKTIMDCGNNWYCRRDRVIHLIEECAPDLLALQEATPSQMLDLREDLNQYDSYGVGRDDGADRGEYSPVFYCREKYERLDQGTFWLSEKPHQPGSRGWDASCPRICSWVKLKDRSADRELYFFNTHVDHQGLRAQQQSAHLLLSQINEIAGRAAPVLLTGDFNSASDSEVHRIMVTDTGLQDAKVLSESAPEGPAGTWSTFKIEHGAHLQLDFIFATQSWLRIVNYNHVTRHYSRFYPSDHLPVLATVDFKPSSPMSTIAAPAQ